MKTLYRVEHSLLDPLWGNPRTRVDKYEVVKETPEGYWVRLYGGVYMSGFKRWMNKTARRRFAHETVADAYRAFVLRKDYHVAHIERELARARDARDEALAKLKEPEGEVA